MVPPPAAPAMPAAPVRESDQATRLRALVEALQRVGPAGSGPLGAARVIRDVAGAPTPARPRTGAEAPPAELTIPVIAVASGKGGVGKTNLSVNVCIALAGRGLRPVLIDADLGLANADVLLNLNPSARLDQAVDGPFRAPNEHRPCVLADLAVDAPGGFRLVPGAVAQTRMANLDAGQRQRLVQGLASLGASADVLVVDTAAGIAAGVTAFLRAADLAVIVTTPEPTAIADAYAVIKCLKLAGDTPHLGLVVNMAADEAEAWRVHDRVAMVARRFLNVEVPMLGWVGHDAQVPAAVRARVPLLLRTPEAPAAQHVRELAARLAQAAGVTMPRVQTPSRRRSWLGRLLGRARPAGVRGGTRA